MIQVRFKVLIQRIRTDNGTEFVNQTLCEYYEKAGISHETLLRHLPQQNGVVERRNRTLIEAARTMLIYAKAPLFLWTAAVTTTCYTQNRSIIRLRHGKTPYELLHDKPPDLSFFHVLVHFVIPQTIARTWGLQQDFEDFTRCEPSAYRRDLLENLDTLEAVIHRAIITYGRLQLQSQDVQINPVQAVDDSLIVSKSSWIESENNNALSKS
ncbi:retrovirus-related pol polyprotein from transposon TNT 1-94 [Tanacetum coccineum]|uniref:Retrovirus-related pol polyprotein from transposon TNT 1-94 n=1 Tax=Tanacetum coccineum TaxID=301880 RepID=A0ABQ5HHZ2_9ASTR